MGEILVYVTVPSIEEADKIARALVNERLAACVNIVSGVRSIYRWEGQVLSDDELLLIIKTTADRFDALEERVKQLHSYSTPEVIASSVLHGSAEYLSWLRESVSHD